MNIQEISDRIDHILAEKTALEIDKKEMLREVSLCETESAVDYYVAMSREYITTRANLDCELRSLRSVRLMMSGEYE